MTFFAVKQTTFSSTKIPSFKRFTSKLLSQGSIEQERLSKIVKISVLEEFNKKINFSTESVKKTIYDLLLNTAIHSTKDVNKYHSKAKNAPTLSFYNKRSFSGFREIFLLMNHPVKK